MILDRGSIFFKTISLLFFISYELFAQAGTYYDLISPSSPTFINDLKTRIRVPYTQVFYSQFDETNIANFASIDNGDGSRSVFCVYSNYEHVYSGTFSFLPINREHTYAHSWQPTHPSESGPEYSDQYHLFPTHETANSNRGNLPFGNVVTPTLTFGESVAGLDINGDLVFEPRDAHKGDAARALFYMIIKYDGIDGNSWTFDWLNGTRLPAIGIDPQDVPTLISWHKQDPPDKWEVDRNNYIQSIQQNRNPFVDHPEWVDFINFNNLTTYSPIFAVEPQNHVTNFSSSVLSNSITVSWTDAAAGSQTPSGYLLMAYSSNNYFVPVDGSAYTDDTDLSDGVALVNIPYSNPDSYLFSSLPNNTTYYFTIYSYNGTGTQINYKISETVPKTNALVPGSFAAEPINHVTDFATGTINSNSIQLTWTDAAAGTQAPEGYLILGNTSGTFTEPVDGSVYSNDITLSDGFARVNILYSDADMYTFNGLNPNTPYYFRIYPYNGSSTERNYKTDGTVPSTDGTTLSAGGSLSVGDIAIVGFNMDDPDEFAFIPLVDLPSGTQIKFTDNGWTAAGSFRANEGIITFTSASPVPKGTVKIYSTSSSGEFTSSGSFALSVSGDQLLAYTGTEASPYFLYAVNSEATGWQTDATTANNSALPTGLVNGNSAVALDEIDNAIYVGPTNLQPSDFLLSVSNKSNWSGSDATRQTMPSGVFPLPVELTTFTAKVTNNQVTLNWETKTEVSNYGFEIERASSLSSQIWKKIGFVNGAGNSNSPKLYEFTDFDLIPGNYSYRLKQIDVDGSFTYSSEIKVEIIPPVEFSLQQNFPNPFNPSTTISWQSPVSSWQTLKVYDVLGNEITTLVDEYKPAGNYRIEYDAISLTSGIYLYKLQAGDFIEIKKMILLK